MDIDKTIQFILDTQAHLEAQQQRFAAEQERLDKRERLARFALLSGIAAYLRALDDDEESK